MKGFILTGDCKDVQGKNLISLIGTGENGPFEIQIWNHRPLFFIESDATIPSSVRFNERKKLTLKSFGGRVVDCLYFNSLVDFFEARDVLKEARVRTYEADVRPVERFLMERFIHSQVEVQGSFEVQGKLRVYKNPKLKPCDYSPQFNTHSVDIETSMGNDLYSIGYHQVGPSGEFKKVLMVGEAYQEVSDELTLYPSEKEVLEKFMSDFHSLDPDIIVGWHVIGFDLFFLERKCEEFGIKFNLGRAHRRIRLSEKKGAGFFASIPGRQVIDGPQTMRASFYSFENFKLDTVANEILGTGKDITESGTSKVAEIERRFKEDKEGLAKYNLMDCTLVLDIYKKTGLVDLVTTRSKISGLLMDRIGVSTGAFDHFFLPRLHRRGFVASNIIDIEREAQSVGGFVMEPKVGLYKNIAVLDFKSLYPSIIKTFKIDPLSRLMAEKSEDDIITPKGIKLSRTEHILPDYISGLFDKRAQAKLEGDDYLSQSIKILMNSFYGVMGSPGCRFYHSDLPTAITTTGHWILKEAINFFENRDYLVVYGDTDSVFIELKDLPTKNFEQQAAELSSAANDYITRKLKLDYKVDSHLEIEYEKFYRKFFLPNSRDGSGGAKKRYVGLLKNKDGEDVSFAGMEFVRSDWTKVAKNFQMEIYRRLFYAEELDFFIKEYVEKLKNGEFNELLIYRKRLTKDVEEYTKSQPPHVKAAKGAIAAGFDIGRSVEYIMTRRGPISILLGAEDIDYQHYIDKQIKPLAEDVLQTLGLSFDSIITGDQLSLF